LLHKITRRRHSNADAFTVLVAVNIQHTEPKQIARKFNHQQSFSSLGIRYAASMRRKITADGFFGLSLRATAQQSIEMVWIASFHSQ